MRGSDLDAELRPRPRRSGSTRRRRRRRPQLSLLREEPAKRCELFVRRARRRDCPRASPRSAARAERPLLFVRGEEGLDAHHVGLFRRACRKENRRDTEQIGCSTGSSTVRGGTDGFDEPHLRRRLCSRCAGFSGAGVATIGWRSAVGTAFGRAMARGSPWATHPPAWAPAHG